MEFKKQISNETQNESNGVSLLNHEIPFITLKAVVNEEIVDIKLADLKGKYTVLIFYPFDFTTVCPSEIVKISQYKTEFDELNCNVLFISTDSEFSHLAWCKIPASLKGIKGVKFPVVSDYKQELINFLNFKNQNNHSERATCILDGELKIRHIMINDPRVGRSVNETLRLVFALQFIDKHKDEFCLVDWEAKKENLGND